MILDLLLLLVALGATAVVVTLAPTRDVFVSADAVAQAIWLAYCDAGSDVVRRARWTRRPFTVWSAASGIREALAIEIDGTELRLWRPRAPVWTVEIYRPGRVWVDKLRAVEIDAIERRLWRQDRRPGGRRQWSR